MSKPAARVGDLHVCPMVTPGVPPVPHVGGPITGPGVTNVLIGGMPAAVLGDMCTCVGPPDSIVMGSSGVLIGGRPAARVGDVTVHGGTISIGCMNVLIGGVAPGQVMTKSSLTTLEKLPAKASKVAKQVTALQQAAENGKPFCEECEVEEKPKIFNLQWIKNKSVVTESRVLKKVTLRANTENIGDGTSITFKVKRPKTLLQNGTLQGEGDVIELTGTVKKNQVEVEWEIEDPEERKNSNPG